MIAPEEYARLIAQTFDKEEQTAMNLYAPVAARALDLEAAVKDEAGEESVMTLAALFMRLLLAPGAVFGADAPHVDYKKLVRIWEIGTQKGRYLASLRELQMLAASYVGVAASLDDDPTLRSAKLDRMGREAEVMLEHLGVIVGHYGYRLGQIAGIDVGDSASAHAA